jgi:AmpD protein
VTTIHPRVSLQLDAAAEWLNDVRRVVSSNCDSRPPGVEVSLIVVHGISLPPGEYGGPWIDRLFTNRLDPDAHPCFRDVAGLRVSAHVLIRRDGELVQYVPFTRRAWHAGPSSFRGCEACNDFSIGIELEGCDEDPYRTIQYVRLAELIQLLRRAYPAVTAENIVGHNDVAPGRKTDPGPAFDWSRLHGMLAGTASA